MNYKSYEDLSLTINKNIHKIPRDIDLVVGVPRSGMLPATMIGLIINKPVVALDSYIDGEIYEMGLYRRPKTMITNISEVKKVLIIDDSINSGNSINKVKEKIRKSDRYSINTIYAAVYYVPGSLNFIDIGLEECSWPRIFQWNILNSWILTNACVDIDGVVCIDPTEDQNDDGDNYRNFLSNAKPLFLTEFPISCFVSSRLEKYRELTEEWLRLNNFNYSELIMLDLPSKEERIKQNIHARFKADIYRNRKEELFIESNLSQALEIAQLTGKIVFCTENMKMIISETSKKDFSNVEEKLINKINIPSESKSYSMQEHENLSIGIIKNFVKKCDLFVDVGANYGYYSLLAADANKEIRIVAIEPIEENFKVLNKNLIHNNVGTERVKCINAVVSSSSKKIMFYKSEASDNSSVIPHPNSSTLEELEVSSVSLDDLLENEQYKSLFIKTDTDGNELKVLKGLASTLEKCDDITILLEINPKMLKLAGTSCEAIAEYLYAHDFSLYAIDDKEFRYYPLDLKENLAMMSGIYETSYFNVLCVKRKKALSVVFFSHSAGLYGAERSLLDLVRGLSERGVLCTAVLPAEGVLMDAFKDQGCAVYVLPKDLGLNGSWWWSGLYINEGFNKKIAYTFNVTRNQIIPELKKLSPDLIFSQSIVSPWGAVCAGLLGIPHVLSAREYGVLDHNLQFYFGFEESMNAFYESSDEIFCITNDVRDTLFGEDKDLKTSVVYSDIQVDYVSKVTNESDLTFNANWDSGLTVGNFGTIGKGKGQEDIVRACIELCKKGLDVHCILAGAADKEYLGYLNQIMEDSGFSDRFSRYDFVDDPYRLMGKVDIIISCSRREALGRTLIEAILLGKPIIYANSGGPKEVFTNDVHGLAYEVGEYQSLANNIMLTVNNKQKTQKRISCAREYVMQKFNSENYAGKIETKIRALKEKKYKRARKNAVISLTSKFGIDDLSEIFIQPKLFYSDNLDNFNEAQTVITKKIPIGLISVEFILPDRGFNCLRIDLTEEYAIDLAIYKIVITTDGGDVIINPQMELYSNGFDTGKNSWKFLNFDPQVLIKLKSNVKSIKFIGEVKILDNKEVVESLNNAFNFFELDKKNEKLKEQEENIQSLQTQVSFLEKIAEEREVYAKSLEEVLNERERNIQSLQTQVSFLEKIAEEREVYAKSLEEVLNERERNIQSFQTQVSILEKTAEERNVYVKSLEGIINEYKQYWFFSLFQSITLLLKKKKK